MTPAFIAWAVGTLFGVATLATRASKYPRIQTVGSTALLFLARLAPVQFKDAERFWSMPFKAPDKPADMLLDETPTKPTMLPPSLLILAFLATCLLSCGVKPQVLVRDGIASAASMVKAGYAVARDGTKSCYARAAALPAKADAQRALDTCKASWDKELTALDRANALLLDADKALPAFDAGAKAVDGKTAADWVAALAAAATAAAKIADLPPVKELR